MSGKSHYEVLGVARTASEDEIKRAYRALSLQYHPDRTNGDTTASELYKTINAAYEVLGDPDSRAQYDRQGMDPMSAMFGGGGGGGGGGEGFAVNPADMEALFGMLFGGGMPPGVRVMHAHGAPFDMFAQMRKPMPIIKTLCITIEQCYTGCTAAIEVERTEAFDNETRTEKEVMYVEIPAGIDDKEIIILRDRGHLDRNHVFGDVKLIIQVENNSPLQRSGLDLVFRKTLSLKESLCGFSFHIPHISGKSLNINNAAPPTVVKPGFRKVIPGYGMLRDGRTGNLVIDFDVEFPDTLNEEQVTAIAAVL